jgi:hypothetical protein
MVTVMTTLTPGSVNMAKGATYPAQSLGGTVAANDIKLRVSGLHFFYGPKQSLFDISI